MIDIMELDIYKYDDVALFERLLPSGLVSPVLLVSPHSGADYSKEFLRLSCLDMKDIRKSEDAYVDRLFEGASLAENMHFNPIMIRALFPRAFIDVNRGIYEIDPTMFEGDVPLQLQGASPNVAAGLGVIPRIVAKGYEIYDGKLDYCEAKSRLDEYYKPFHAAILGLITKIKEIHGYCILLDCHSMPHSSVSGVKTWSFTNGDTAKGGDSRNSEAGKVADFTIGDCFGITADSSIPLLIENYLRNCVNIDGQSKYEVWKNRPYAGGYITRHYGKPEDNIHAIQIEINRSLYMDEKTYEKLPHFDDLAKNLVGLVRCLENWQGNNLTEAAE